MPHFEGCCSFLALNLPIFSTKLSSSLVSPKYLWHFFCCQLHTILKNVQVHVEKAVYMEDANSSALLASCSLFYVSLCPNCRRVMFIALSCPKPEPSALQTCRGTPWLSVMPVPRAVDWHAAQVHHQSHEPEHAPGLGVRLDLWCPKLLFLTWDFNACH